LQARAHLAQHVVAHAVAEGIVDVLEPVQVHHEDGEAELPGRSLRDGQFEFIRKA
jgi:hypothetical protein